MLRHRFTRLMVEGHRPVAPRPLLRFTPLLCHADMMVAGRRLDTVAPHSTRWSSRQAARGLREPRMPRPQFTLTVVASLVVPPGLLCAVRALRWVSLAPVVLGKPPQAPVLDCLFLRVPFSVRETLNPCLPQDLLLCLRLVALLRAGSVSTRCQACR